ncbi:acyl carrier protein [Alteromonas portus]|uniref:acyl carrier protein n=1 Tax=Alteromonas portus TaxID=2565549 RepID=UPI003BF7B9DA
MMNKEKICNYIDEIAQSKGVKLPSENLYEADLIDYCILDSLGILQLMTFLESEFNIHVLPAEMLIEKFRNITSISNFIEHKTAN